MNFVTAICLSAILCAVGDQPTKQTGQTLESIKKEILQNWSRVESVTADVSVTGFLEQEAGGARTSGGGSFAAMRIGGEYRYRSELQMITSADQFNGGELRMDFSELSILDGTEVKTLKSATVLGNKTVIAFHRHRERDPTMDLVPIVDADQVFNLLTRVKSMSMRLVQASPVDLPPVYAVELTFPHPVEMASMVVYFDRKTGMVLRTRAEGRGIEWWCNVDYQNVKLNGKLDPNQFVFRLPKGVEFMDMKVPPRTPGPNHLRTTNDRSCRRELTAASRYRARVQRPHAIRPLLRPCHAQFPGHRGTERDDSTDFHAPHNGAPLNLYLDPRADWKPAMFSLYEGVSTWPATSHSSKPRPPSPPPWKRP